MNRLTALTIGLALAMVGLVGSSGCEKDQPSAAKPDESPPIVIIEDPGAVPSPEPAQPPQGDPESAAGTSKIVVSEVACQSDADCVKSSCCHATSCVALADAPDCSSAMCTTDCRAGTMDCNGGCLCQAGKCAAQLWWAPE